MSLEKEKEYFKEFDSLLRQLVDLEPAQGILRHGGAILLRWRVDHVDIKYEGGVFDRLERAAAREVKAH